MPNPKMPMVTPQGSAESPAAIPPIETACARIDTTLDVFTKTCAQLAERLTPIRYDQPQACSPQDKEACAGGSPLFERLTTFDSRLQKLQDNMDNLLSSLQV